MSQAKLNRWEAERPTLDRIGERVLRLKEARHRPVPWEELRELRLTDTGLCPHDIRCKVCPGDSYKFDQNLSRDIPPGMSETIPVIE